MMMDGGGRGLLLKQQHNHPEAYFPVLFFDGEKTVDVGSIPINPGMNFKGFQTIISQKLGISPHQITTYIERTPPPPQALLFPTRSVGAAGRRFPVTNKFNFAAAMAERNSAYFLVVSKKSRRTRRRRHRLQQQHQQQASVYGGSGNRGSAGNNHSPDGFVLLRRPDSSYSDYVNQAAAAAAYFEQGHQTAGENWYAPPVAAADYMEYSSNLMSAVEREREKYLMSLDLNSDVYSEVNVRSWLDKSVGGGGTGSITSELTSEDGVSSWGGVSSSTGAASQGGSCEVCASAAVGQAVPFHCCKLDAVVTESFRSRAGPIARPRRL